MEDAKQGHIAMPVSHKTVEGIGAAERMDRNMLFVNKHLPLEEERSQINKRFCVLKPREKE